MDKRTLSERDICTKFVPPALRKAGWDEMLQIREEVGFTKGRIIVRGKLVTRGQAKRADYIPMTKPIRFEHLQGCIDWWGGAKRKGREEGPQAWKVTAEEVKARGYNLDIKNPHSVADDHGDPEMLLADLARAEAETAAYRDQLKAILAEALAR